MKKQELKLKRKTLFVFKGDTAFKRGDETDPTTSLTTIITGTLSGIPTLTKL